MHEVEHAELCIENIKPQMKLIERFGSFFGDVIWVCKHI